MRPIQGLSLSAMGFLIDLTSELTIDGDTASTTPSGPTRRYGVELTGRYNFDQRLYADVSFTVAHARFTDAADVAAGTVTCPTRPSAPSAPASAAASRSGGGDVARIGDRAIDVATATATRVRRRSSRPAGRSSTPKPASRWKHLELVADLLNVADVKWREGQFEVGSRLPGRGHQPAAPGISFTPGLPRTLMTHAAVYW